jgi:hypothetical protein
MAVYLKYGAYRHDDNEVTVSISRSAIDSGNGRYIGVAHRWSITGQLLADTQAELATKVQLLESAYARWNRDLVLYGDGDRVLHALLNAGSTTGVRITDPVSYPDGTGAQWSTFRDYTIGATAEYPVTTGFVLRSFSEAISRSGGHPRIVALECVNGPADIQMVAQRTAYRVQQSGSATAFRGKPTPPPPYWPAFLESSTVTEIAPQFQNGELTDAGVQWSYSFVSAAPLLGAPASFPG